MTSVIGPVWNISGAGDDGVCFISSIALCVGGDTEAVGVDASLPC